MDQVVHPLGGPLLDWLQSVNIFLVLHRPKLGIAPQLWSHNCGVEGNNHFFILANAAWAAVGLPCRKGALLVNLVSTGTSRLICKATFQPARPQPVLYTALSLTRAGLGVSLCWTSLGSCQPISQAFSTVYWLLSVLTSSENLQTAHSFPSSSPLVQTLNNIGPSMDLWGTLQVSSCYLVFVPMITTVRGWRFMWFSTQLLVPSFSLPLTNFFLNSIPRRYGRS